MKPCSMNANNYHQGLLRIPLFSIDIRAAPTYWSFVIDYDSLNYGQNVCVRQMACHQVLTYKSDISRPCDNFENYQTLTCLRAVTRVYVVAMT